jgi:hypothetical protein
MTVAVKNSYSTGMEQAGLTAALPAILNEAFPGSAPMFALCSEQPKF